jgi:hypothetical protein
MWCSLRVSVESTHETLNSAKDMNTSQAVKESVAYEAQGVYFYQIEDVRLTCYIDI